MDSLPKVFMRDKSHNRLLTREYGYWGVEVADYGLTFFGYQDKTEHVAFSDLVDLPEVKSISVTDNPDKYVLLSGVKGDFNIRIKGKQSYQRHLYTLESKAYKDDDGYSATVWQEEGDWNWVLSGISRQPRIIEELGGFIKVSFQVKGGNEFELFGLKRGEFEELKASARSGQYEVPSDDGKRNWEFLRLPGQPKVYEPRVEVIKFWEVSFQTRYKYDGELAVTGLNSDGVEQLLSCVKSARRSYYMAPIKDLVSNLRSLADKIATHLEAPKQFPTARLIEPILSDAKILFAKLPTRIPHGVLTKNEQIQIGKVRGFANDPHKLREKAIERFIKSELIDLSSDEVEQLLSYAQSARRNHYIASFEDLLPKFKSVADKIATHLEAPKHYPAAHLIEPILSEAKMLSAKLPTDIPDDILTKDEKVLIDRVRGFADAPHEFRDDAIESFIERELKEYETLFDKIESNPLTLEQRRAVIANEDATLVLAGAGSGKTSVIVAKVAYLIKRGARPEEILVLSYNRDPANEMGKRLKSAASKMDDDLKSEIIKVRAKTFHGFGYRVIGSPNCAEWVGPGKPYEVKFRNHLRDKVKDVTEQNSELGLLLKKYFYDFYLPYKSEFDFKNQQEYEEYVHSHGELLTLTGDTVKSVEELRIANWLSMNGIDYKYERKYPHKLPNDWKSRRGYKPDFYLTESGIYIEHFGLGRDNQTAPWVDSAEYLAEIEGKRKVHQDNKTTLIETFSYEHREQIWRDTLAKHLDSHGVKLSPVSQGEILEMLKKLEENSKVDAFTETLKRFLVQFKELDITIKECVPVDGERSKAFLDLFEPVYQSYQKGIEDSGVIDFTDQIVHASRHIGEGKYNSKFKYILVDEFQDISDSRARLLKALKAQHHDARLFAVGDDWQSINRFSGTNIGLMHDFGQEFGGKFAGASDIHRTAPLGHTFRFSGGIAKPAARFILKNESQIPKKISTEHVKHKKSSITIAYTCRSCATEKISQGLAALARVQPIKDTKKLSILFLGRENSLKPANFDAVERRYRSKLSIKFMSVHASKGLEADRVIVLDVKSGKKGFPSERLDDPVLNMVLPEQEELKRAEERRLFYVALTRAKEKVTIFADKRKPSVFVTELLKDSECKVRSLCDHRTCPKCDEGWLRPVSKRDGTVFLGCSRYFSDDCTFTESIAKSSDTN